MRKKFLTFMVCMTMLGMAVLPVFSYGDTVCAAGMNGQSASKKRPNCGVKGCKRTGKHSHPSCGVEGCRKTGKHSHAHANKGKGHHAKHGHH